MIHLTNENFALFSRVNSCEILINNDIFLAAPTGEDGVHPAVQQGGRIPPLLHSAACQEEGWRCLSRSLRVWRRGNFQFSVRRRVKKGLPQEKVLPSPDRKPKNPSSGCLNPSTQRGRIWEFRLQNTMVGRGVGGGTTERQVWRRACQR
jgi:hypothetical protein